MNKSLVKKILFVVFSICFIFILFWSEGFGLVKSHAYGKTIDEALNFWDLNGMRPFILFGPT